MRLVVGVDRRVGPYWTPLWTREPRCAGQTQAPRPPYDDWIVATVNTPGPNNHRPFPRVPLEIVHEDDRLVVLNKPSGLLSVPGIGEAKADCLASRVAEAIPGARIVHRLDRDTSGVIVMALDEQTHRDLSVQFQDRKVDKIYIAMVHGVINENEGVIDKPMRKDLDHPPMQIIDHTHGRSAVTHWRVLERQSDRTRLELKPITGRSHQLRLHLKTIGHPILGDDLYAPDDVLRMADRLLLHATSLTFAHPSTGQRLTYRVEPPF